MIPVEVKVARWAVTYLIIHVKWNTWLEMEPVGGMDLVEALNDKEVIF